MPVRPTAEKAARASRFKSITEAEAALLKAFGPVLFDMELGAAACVGSGCFAAGTLLATPEGHRPIESFVAGDTVLSRDQFDPDAAVGPQVVEEVFVRAGRILEMMLEGGRLIRTTPEHPFWKEGAGWTQAGALAEGDLLRCGDGTSV